MHQNKLLIPLLTAVYVGLLLRPACPQEIGTHVQLPHDQLVPQPVSVTFRYQPASDGSQIWQHVTFFANTLTTYKQSGQVISRRQIFMTREQIRRVTVLEAGKSRHLVEVQYEKAQQTRSMAGMPPETEPQVVADKCYLVSREQDELHVRDKQGQPVTKAEEQLVKQNMQAVGRPNALAEFLQGRTLAVGQSESLPRDVVEQLLGWQDAFGTVQSVTLQLDRVKLRGATQIAECRLEITCTPAAELSSPTTMQGTVELQTDTCRVLATAMKAELNVREQRGPADHPFFVTHEGQANVHSQVRLIR